MSSDPPSSGSVDDGWGSVDEAPADRAAPPPGLAAAERDLELLRETMPPPVPVAVYVRTMMSQADEDDDMPSSQAGGAWRGEPPISGADRPASALGEGGDAYDAYDGGVLSLRVPNLPEITAEVDVGELVDLVTLEEIDALAKRAVPSAPSVPAPPDEPSPLSDNPFPGAVVPVPKPESRPPHTLRTPQSDPSVGGPAPNRKSPAVPDVVLGSPLEPEPLFEAGGSAIIDPAQALDPFNFPGPIDDHPFSERAPRVMSEMPNTRPWSSSPPRAPARSVSPVAADPRGSIPPILAAWSTPAPSEHPPSTMKGPFGDRSPPPPRPAAPSPAQRASTPPPRAVAPSPRAAAAPAPRAAPRASASPFPRTAQSAPIRSAPSPSLPEPSPPEPARDYLGEIQERLDAGDDLGAMRLAENLLTIEPGNTEASQCVEICRGRLIDKLMARLGGPRRIPRVAISMDQIRWLALDHRAGFLLSNVDGTMTIEEVLDVSGMPELDALRLLDDLCAQGVIEVPAPRPRR